MPTPPPSTTVRTVPTSSTPPPVPAGVPPARVVGPVDEVEQLLGEDYAAEELRARQAPSDRPAVGVGPWLAAIAVTIALAVLAGVLITRSQGIIGGGGDLPSATEVRSRVERIFTDMKSLKATFSIRRLGLYRTSGSQSSLVYSFADGRYDGRFVYDRNEGYRQELTLDVRDQEIARAKIVQTADETRSLLGTGSTQDLLVERRPPFGPPDGELRPTLGLFEEALGTVVREIVDATDLEVVGKTTQGERELFEVRTAVTPNELTRADRFDVYLETRSFFPVIVRRTISRGDAHVLGPGQVLGDDAIAKAFGDRQRVTTELVEIDNPVVDDIILPGDFVLDAPQGLKTQTSDSSFERVTRADVASKLKFEPLFPRSLPGSYKEEALAVYNGEARPWGPSGKFPAPDGIMHASYFDGKATIVVTERNIPSGPFDLTQSPLQRSGLPITVRQIVRAEKRFSYGYSPEVPPHAYGFLGNVFAMVVGYAPAEDLIDILSALGEAPAEVPAPVSASPGTTAGPTSSPASASPSPTPVRSPSPSG